MTSDGPPTPNRKAMEVAPASYFSDFGCFYNLKPLFIQAMLTFPQITK